MINNSDGGDVHAFYDAGSNPHPTSTQCKRIVDNMAILLPEININDYSDVLSSCFPSLMNYMNLLGYDWQGRPFGISKDSQEVLLYDSIFDELMAFSFQSDNYLSATLFDTSLDNFGKEFFAEFCLRNNLIAIPLHLCAGFRIPPQLGGKVHTDNLELYDVFTYWNFTKLITDEISSMPDGTVLRDIRLNS